VSNSASTEAKKQPPGKKRRSRWERKESQSASSRSSGSAIFCPNCGGGFQVRPVRPAQAWRAGTGLVNDPSGTRRRHTSYTREEIEAFTKTLRDVPPGER
jgi:hypothetical protein